MCTDCGATLITRNKRSAGSHPGGFAPEHRSYRDLQLIARLFGQARRYWANLIVLFGLGILATPLALLAPLPLKIVVDNVINGKPLTGFVAAIVPSWATGSSTQLLVYCVVLLLSVTLLAELASLVSYVLSTYTGEKLVLGFRVRLFEHVQRLSLAYHDTRGTADSTYRIQYDAASVQNVVLNGLTPFVTAAVMFVGMVYVTARIDWELALIALIVSPILALLTEIKRRRLRQGWKDAKRLESSSFAVVQEALTSLRVVRAFGQEGRERDRFADRSNESVQKKISLSLVDGSISLLFAMTTAAGTAAVLYVGATNVQNGTLTLGSLLLIMGYLVELYTPLTQIAKSITQLQSSLASAERAFTTLDEEPAVRERPDAKPLERARGNVSFRAISFGYTDERSVLDDVTFDVPAGARVGVSGMTGAGKTTLVNLLTRFYDPTEGAILLDGVDLRDYKLADLHRQFAIVLQEPVLFSTSIRENIGYGRPRASQQEIVAAAAAANVHDFISSLPDGYDTEVGERGMRLSGGERQRISIARAFLKDAPILILDEPTSSVDTKTETGIMSAMELLMQGRTTFMIAHRLSTLERCDIRVEIVEGEAHVTAAATESVGHAVP